MKRFIICLLMVLFTSCSSTWYATQRAIDTPEEISFVLSNYYPQLYEYYLEGVLVVKSIKEIELEDGSVDYKVKYGFVRYYYRDFNEKLNAIKNVYPELYSMCLLGNIRLYTVYKYVDRESGRLKLHVSYTKVYGYYYRDYPGIYRTRVYPLHRRPYVVPPRQRMQPTPPRRPEPNRPNSNTRPNNRRVQPQGNRPTTPPTTSPSNPPRQQSGNRSGQTRGGNGGRR